MNAMLRARSLLPVAALAVLAGAGTSCEVRSSMAAPAGAPRPTPADAKAFVAKANVELKRLLTNASTAEWIKSTYITDDTERNAATLNEQMLGYTAAAIKESVRFRGLALDPETARMIQLLRVSQSLMAPSDPARRLELTGIGAKLEGLYGKGKWCGPDGKRPCRDLEELSKVMAKSRRYDELLDAWTGWHTISREMRPMYARFVELANQGAREIGFADTGEMWRSGYDMSAADFEKDTDRLWNEVKPFYEDLHCYVRARLAKLYGADKVPAAGPIPAHLLGNMWAQDWEEIYPLVEPYKGQSSLDVTAALVRQKYDERKMVKLGEAFFTSLGFDALPRTFWDRSMFSKPRDRDVVCHASAWDITFEGDLRLKMCIKQEEESLITIHHELGHNYYFAAYGKLPVLFQQGANDGFHEAIGDAIALAITPGYLEKVGLLKAAPKDEKGLINVQMKRALGKVAFLPFGKLIDKWRWDVFSGKTAPSSYNQAWWDLRRRLQGVDAPVARSEADFDPGAKFHVPANVPYTRYFIAHLLQFQFYRAMCRAAGHTGPLHTCSFYGNREAGAKLRGMLALGASVPWPDALAALTGERRVEAAALLEYFAPLRTWLKEENRGRTCGW